MSTSGVTTFQLTRDQLITAALRKLGVVGQGQTPSTEDYTNGTQAINAMVAGFRALGMPLWARKTYSFSPTSTTSSYNIGVGQTLNTPYPIRLLQAYRQDTASSARIPMEIVPDYDFNMFPSTSGGQPIQVTYQPKVNFGVLQLWPTPDTTTTTVYIVYHRPFEYFNVSSDTMDFPEEWSEAIIYGAASRLAPEYGIPLNDRRTLAAEAQQFLENALANSVEQASFQFQPDTRSE